MSDERVAFMSEKWPGLPGSRGGHIILHEAKLVIRLNPGDIILFPSACITHANLPISTHETRTSMVLYSTGGLFRHNNQGMRTKAAWKAADNGVEEVEAHEAAGSLRWEMGWELYSTLMELDHVFAT